MTDNTKLKIGLRYSPQFGCIVESTFNNNETKISDYDQINQIINEIKSKKAFASSVQVYILQVPLPKFPPVVIALILNNGSDKTVDIVDLHQKLLMNIALQLNLYILISIGSDGALVEFQTQTLIQSMSIDERLQMIDTRFDITFSCPIIPSVGPVLRVQGSKHAKKTCQNVIMSGAQVLSFGRSTARFDHFLLISQRLDSVMYKQDVVKLDRQDDAAAYRAFCSSNLKTSAPQNSESMVLLVKAHREYYPSVPLLLWMHGSEAAEYFFGIARQINPDFTFAELIYIVPKIAQYSKALRNDNFIYAKENQYVKVKFILLILTSKSLIFLDVQYVLLDGLLNFTQMIEIRAKHEAYNLKVLE
ncbi:hypothetical protein RhiirA1_389574 [Rhizophagus irregularis]|uniref:Uncharacterized protein n=1 Tax=Rhizophagus irregularis TaxID=588596 RepID=A0A2N0SAX4_9GLOM|nr:hypothetical protein RhiirA1_389574 [Rhizophagus irregularis]